MSVKPYNKRKAASGFGTAMAVLGGLNKARQETKALTGIGSIRDIAEKAKSFTPTGRALHKAQVAKAMHDPFSKSILEGYKNISALGMDAMSAKQIAEAQKNQYEALLKAKEYQRSQSLLGRAGDSTFGRIALPLLGMSMITGGGMAAKKFLDVAAVSGVNLDPSARLASTFGLKRVLEVKPELAQFPIDKLKRHFETLFNTSPEIAKDPMLAANMLDKMLRYDGLDHNVARELGATQNELRKPYKDQVELFSVGNSSLFNR